MRALTLPRHRVARWGAAILALLAIAEAILLWARWPFSERKVIASLEQMSSCRLHVARYRMTYLPTPGYIADNITLERFQNGHAVQIGSLKRMVCKGSWVALASLTHRVYAFRLEGLKISIPRPLPPPVQFTSKGKSQLTTGRVVADGGILEIAAREPGGQPVRIQFSRLRLLDVNASKPFHLDATLKVSLFPSAMLSAVSTLGPIDVHGVPKIPLSGSYRLQNFDLSRYNDLAGILASDGHFRGSLGNCRLNGHIAIQQFGITTTHHVVGIGAEFVATADTVHANAAVNQLDVHFLNTILNAHGSVEEFKGAEGKVPSFDVTSADAHVEDLLYVFSSSDPPSLSGPMRLHANTWLPTGPGKFLQKLRLIGSFEISRAEFSNRKIQQRIDTFAIRARGGKVKENNPPFVPSTLEGKVSIKNGTAIISDAAFETVGATVTGGGSYNLINSQVDISGKLATRASLSHDTGGLKSILLVPLDPFYKKNGAGAVIPISISGRYPNARFRASLTGKKKP